MSKPVDQNYFINIGLKVLVEEFDTGMKQEVI